MGFPKVKGVAHQNPTIEFFTDRIGVVICLGRGADLHMAQLMPLLLQ